MLKINIDNIGNFISVDKITDLQTQISKINDLIYSKSGKGKEFLGWIDLPSKTDKDIIIEIEDTASLLRSISDIIVVIGIGGSYLGARAVIDSLSNNFNHLLNHEDRHSPLVIYAGNNISEDYHYDLMKILDNKNSSLIVISKSGTTTEPAIAFRLLKAHIEKKYGKEEASRRIVIITDKSKGALRKLSETNKYKTFIIPDDIGGRFSVLTPVGLLPISAAGFNIKSILEGAKDMQELCFSEKSIKNNPADLYGAVRNLLYNKGFIIEILAAYLPNMNYFIEWWKQLFGESEGKEGKGIYPSGACFTTDLHSLGQLIQEGNRNIFETVLDLQESNNELKIPYQVNDTDELNYIHGKRLNDINRIAMQGTINAHVSGGVPDILLQIPKLNEYYIGQLIYFFEKACAVSGYLLGVNPFDQPGVEVYKKNMFKLLNKPGY